MKTLHSTTLALLVGATLVTGSALAASSYWDSVPTDVNPGNPPSTASTTYSGQFAAPPSFAKLSNAGEVTHEAIFGPVKAQQFASNAPEYIGTSVESPRSYWDTVPDNH